MVHRESQPPLCVCTSLPRYVQEISRFVWTLSDILNNNWLLHEIPIKVNPTVSSSGFSKYYKIVALLLIKKFLFYHLPQIVTTTNYHFYFKGNKIWDINTSFFRNNLLVFFIRMRKLRLSSSWTQIRLQKNSITTILETDPSKCSRLRQKSSRSIKPQLRYKD